MKQAVFAFLLLLGISTSGQNYQVSGVSISEKLIRMGYLDTVNLNLDSNQYFAKAGNSHSVFTDAFGVRNSFAYNDVLYIAFKVFQSDFKSNGDAGAGSLRYSIIKNYQPWPFGIKT